jgi:branched-chain amino acid transport system substrate-binding protein
MTLIANLARRAARLLILQTAAALAATMTIMPGHAEENSPVRIGVLTDMSGVYSDLGGQGSVEAAKFAVADFGGKVLGRTIEVIAADHQNKPDVGSGIAREWYAARGVNFITDGLNGGVALAVSHIAANARKIFVSTGSVPTALTNEECTPYTIHYVFDAYSLASGTPRILLQQGKKSFFFLTVDYAFGHSLEQFATNAVRAGGGTVTGSVKHPLNTPDLSSFILQAQSSRADVIALSNTGPDAVNAIKQSVEFGVSPKQTVAPLLLLITDTRALGLKAAQNMVVTDAWYWDQDDASRAFAKRFFQKMNRMPSSNHAGVYSSVLSYLKAIEAAKTDDPTAVMAQLKQLEINDLFARGGRIRADGRMVHDMYTYRVKTPEESKYDWDFYTLLGTIPASEAFLPLAQSKCPLVKN